MQRPSIKIALTVALGLVAMAVVAFGTVSIFGMRTISGNSENLAKTWLPKVEMSQEMDTALSDLRRAYLNHIVAIDAGARKSAEEAIKSEQARFKTDLIQYRSMSITPSELTVVNDIDGKFQKIDAIGQTVVRLSDAGKTSEAALLQQSEIKPIATEITTHLHNIVALNVKGAEAAHDMSVEAYHVTMTLALSLIGICLLVVAGSIYFAIAGVAMPIGAITAAMKRLSDGDTQSTVPFGGRSDELGAMAAAVEIFRANAVANQTLERDATTLRNLSDVERQRVAAAERLKADAMLDATASLGEGLKNLAKGNLAFQLDQPFAADFEGLRVDFNASVLQLATTLRAVSASTNTIDNGSREISHSADDLARRTEQQAASLEETAAALDQITTNVANSSQRADEARSVAVKANESAVVSSKVVGNAIAAMSRIEDSSSQIASIIGVIDEIAFQTNLLALNAGVEAARAGDAGKGFAVVAQEVRELAQRSARAAKEIKDLIRTSSAEVSGGVTFVKETGEALATIETYIVTINRHMDAIAVSAREQSVGLAEVNTAVNRMDQVTQQNAAMVEETNAASATLANESARLQQLIGQFTLDGQDRHAATRRAA